MELERPGFTAGVDAKKLVDNERNWRSIAQAFAALSTYEREYESKLDAFEKRAKVAEKRLNEAREELNEIRERTWKAEERARQAEERAREAGRTALKMERMKNSMAELKIDKRATAMCLRQREWDDFTPGELRVTIAGESMSIRQLYCASVLEQRWY